MSETDGAAKKESARLAKNAKERLRKTRLRPARLQRRGDAADTVPASPPPSLPRIAPSDSRLTPKKRVTESRAADVASAYVKRAAMSESELALARARQAAQMRRLRQLETPEQKAARRGASAAYARERHRRMHASAKPGINGRRRRFATRYHKKGRLAKPAVEDVPVVLPDSTHSVSYTLVKSSRESPDVFLLTNEDAVMAENSLDGTSGWVPKCDLPQFFVTAASGVKRKKSARKSKVRPALLEPAAPSIDGVVQKKTRRRKPKDPTVPRKSGDRVLPRLKPIAELAEPVRDEFGEFGPQFPVPVAVKSLTTRGSKRKRKQASDTEVVPAEAADTEEIPKALKKKRAKKTAAPVSTEVPSSDATGPEVASGSAATVEAAGETSQKSRNPTAGPGNRTCFTCNVVFKTRSSLRSHQQRSHGLVHSGPSSDANFTCDLCPRTYNLLRNLGYHKRVAHGILGSSTHLNADKKARRAALQQKISESGPGANLGGLFDARVAQTTDFQCHLCQAYLGSRSCLLSHLRQAHPGEYASTTNRTVRCEKCPRTFVNKGNLQLHVLSAHSDRPNSVGKRIFDCLLCKETFDRQLVYSEHLRTHLGVDGRVQCPACPVSCAYNNLAKHYRIYHLGVRYPCPVCGKQLKYEYARTNHIRRKHPETLPESA